jgi:hypothetical protein
MADSDIKIGSLTANGGANSIVLQWAIEDPNYNGLPYLSFDHAEIWRSARGDMLGATKIGESSTAFVDAQIKMGERSFIRCAQSTELVGSENSAGSSLRVPENAFHTPINF